MQNLTYLIWLTLFVWLPLLVLWTTNFRLLRQYKRTIAFCMFWAVVFSAPWDFWAVQTQIWIFPEETNVGLLLGGVPIEEYLFYTFVTALVSTITLILKSRFRNLSLEE